MSALGQQQTFRDVYVTSASPRWADIDRRLLHVGFGLIWEPVRRIGQLQREPLCRHGVTWIGRRYDVPFIARRGLIHW